MQGKHRRILKTLARLTETTKRPFCSAVIVAGGSASRMGGIDKVFALLEGKPVLLRACMPFQASGLVDEIVVVVRKDDVEKTEKLLRDGGISKLSHVVAGGASRTESVRAGLSAISSKARLSAIHDGARPLISVTAVEKAIEMASAHGTAAPAVPVKDTVKRVENGIVTETPDRAALRAVQTPQVFPPELVLAGIAMAEKKGVSLTDDCSAVELLGVPVYLTEGDYRNLKITTPEDLILADALLREENK